MSGGNEDGWVIGIDVWGFGVGDVEGEIVFCDGVVGFVYKIFVILFGMWLFVDDGFRVLVLGWFVFKLVFMFIMLINRSFVVFVW